MKKNTSNSILSNIRVFFYQYMKLLVVCCLLAFVSCKAKKQLVTTGAGNTAKTADNKRSQLDAIKAAQTNFDTFSGKAHTKLSFSGSSNDVTLNIHIKKDQKIWISVTAIAGIEVARVLITPDSILIINRLQSEYVKKPFSYLNKIAGDQVNFQSLESLFIGNAVPQMINENADLQSASGNTTLTGNLSGFVYTLTLGTDLRVNQTALNNQAVGQSMQITNSAFVAVGTKVLPSQIDMTSVVKDKKLAVNLHYIKEDFDLPLEYPFTIPPRYKPME